MPITFTLVDEVPADAGAVGTPVFAGRILPAGALFPVLGTLLVAVGLGFTVWARRHLGTNWSSQVQVKQATRWCAPDPTDGSGIRSTPGS